MPPIHTWPTSRSARCPLHTAHNSHSPLATHNTPPKQSETPTARWPVANAQPRCNRKHTRTSGLAGWIVAIKKNTPAGWLDRGNEKKNKPEPAAFVVLFFKNIFLDVKNKKKRQQQPVAGCGIKVVSVSCEAGWLSMLHAAACKLEARSRLPQQQAWAASVSRQAGGFCSE